MNKSLKTTNRIIVILTAGFAIAFMFTIHLRPYTLTYLVKSLPIFLLSLLIFLNIKNSKGKLISLGLFFSGIGDIVLDYPAKGLFVFGIIAFTIAHLFYISVFLRNIKFTKKAFAVILLLLIYSTILGTLLYPKLGDMAIPIFTYLGIILIMAGSAALGNNNHYLLILGAVLFIISDSLIAIGRFITPITYSSHWIMSTYYIAQILIVLGTLASFKKQ